MKKGFIKHNLRFINEWEQIIHPCNWNTFDIITFQIDRDYVSNDITVDLILLGLGIRFYHNFN